MKEHFTTEITMINYSECILPDIVMGILWFDITSLQTKVNNVYFLICN